MSIAARSRSVHEAARQHGFQLRGENERSPTRRVDRLDAETIACDNCAPARFRPRRRAPNFPRSRSTNASPASLVEVGEDLGVAAAPEAVPRRASSVANAVVVVQLAVLDRRDRSVLVLERLVPALESTMQSAATPSAMPGAAKKPRSLRPPVGHDVGPCDRARRARRPPSGKLADLSDAADAAHIERG